MAPHKFLLSGKAVVIALLLFAAAPPVLAQVSPPAADSLLQQLQAQKIEAEARAAEAEKREREAEINRLTEQARQEKFRAAEAEQRARGAERKQDVLTAKSELENSAYARLEVIVGLSIGFFGILITLIVLFITLRTEKAAVASAIDAGKRGIEEIQERAKEAVAEIEEKTHEAEAHLREILENKIISDKLLEEITQNHKFAQTSPAFETLESGQDRAPNANVAREALAMPPRTANEFRTLIIHLQIREAWTDMLEAAQQMRLLHGEVDSDFVFARLNEGVALNKLKRHDEEVNVYDDVIARVDASPDAGLRQWAASAGVNKGVTLIGQRRFDDAIAAFDDVIVLYGAATELALREHAANARLNKGVLFFALNRFDDAIAEYDVVIEGYGAASEAGLREVVTRAFYYKVRTYAKRGLVAEAITVLQEMLRAGHPLPLKQIADVTDFDSIREHPDFKKFLKENGAA